MKSSIIAKILLVLGFVVVVLFTIAGYLFVENDNELIDKIRLNNLKTTMEALNIREKEQLVASENIILNKTIMIAKNSSNFLFNFNTEGLKDSIKFDIHDDTIRAIEIWDNSTDKLYLFAYKNDNNVLFSNIIDKSFNKFNKFTEIIYQTDGDEKYNIGKITLYYDDATIKKRIYNLKVEAKKEIDKFNENIDREKFASNKTKTYIAIGFLITILLTISVLIIQFVKKPLIEFQRGLNSFFDHLTNRSEEFKKIDINTIDEFGQMAKSVNKNIDISINLQKEIYELNTNLEEKIDLRTKELEEAKIKAENATEMKSNFLANMSHEIRTPMNGVMGMTQLALKTDLDSKQKHYLDTINSSAGSLLSLINDILDLSKIEAGKLEIDKIDFNLHDIILNIQNLIEIKANEKGLNFEVVYDKNIPINLFGDPLRISQVLINLINNAIKFTQKGYVKLVITNNSNKFKFEVIDTGIGISKEEKNTLFKSFSQVDAGTTRKYGGTGLGLFVSKQLIELMDGNIGAKSIKDEGSTFHFELELPKVDSVVTENNSSSKIANSEFLANSNILLVEDNMINQEIILGLLEDSGINIDIASNGKEAVNMYEANPQKYELLLMDIQMPIMDGYEATKIIRELNKNIPIIALTANAMSSDKELTKQAGMNAHLDKPIVLKELNEVLLKYISKK